MIIHSCLTLGLAATDSLNYTPSIVFMVVTLVSDLFSFSRDGQGLCCLYLYKYENVCLCYSRPFGIRLGYPLAQSYFLGPKRF